jgi:hypothetical protein
MPCHLLSEQSIKPAPVQWLKSTRLLYPLLFTNAELLLTIIQTDIRLSLKPDTPSAICHTVKRGDRRLRLIVIAFDHLVGASEDCLAVFRLITSSNFVGR